MRKRYLPETISDQRLDLIIEIYNDIRQGRDLILSFSKTKLISPSGTSLLCNLIDSASEFKTNIEFIDLDINAPLQIKLNELSKAAQESQFFLKAEMFQFENDNSINWFKVASIAPELIQKIENKFQK